MKTHNPRAIAPPAGAYTHAIEIPAGARTLLISGQVGIAPDGTVPDDVGAQTAVIFENIRACLGEAGMEMRDIVKLSSFLLDPNDLSAYATARVAALGDHRPTSTLVFVSGLVKPEWKVEVEVIAARAG